MKVAYIRPYAGEFEILHTIAPEHEWVMVDAIADLSESDKASIEVLSVFVDVPIDVIVLGTFPNLKMIAARSAGYDHIDIEAARSRGVVVCRVPHYGTRTVAEYAIALMFSLSRNAFRSYTAMQQNAGITKFESYEGFDLYGKTLGVIGTGAIGASVCEIARGIGMNVQAHDVEPNVAWAAEQGIVYDSLDEVLSVSDIVTLHVPAIPATHHLINADRLRLMKKGSYLINTARGEVVDTKALVQALQSGHLAGAGLDVLEGEHALKEEAELLAAAEVDRKLWETLVADHALIDMPNVIVTPHIAFNTIEAKREITEITTTNITAYSTGVIKNQI